ALITLDLCADRRQRLGKRSQATVLDVITHLSPARVVAVLLAAARVATRGLQVSASIGTDPDVRPGWRNGQRLEPHQHLGVGDALALAIEVLERVTVLGRALAANAWS